jgi:hypothetical protein
MREICTSGSVGGLGRPIVAALGLPDEARGPPGPDEAPVLHRARNPTQTTMKC